MNTNRLTLTLEHFLYLAGFTLALGLRLYHLNAHPLTEAEAREALLAYRLIRGTIDATASLPHSPAYFTFAYLSFLVFGASEAIARLAPAVFGAALVFLPAFFSDKLGRGAALVTGALIGLSSTFLAASRSADGAVIALWALGFGLGALRRYLATTSTVWLVAGGALLGLGLASGPTFLTGLLALALTFLVGLWVNPDERENLSESWTRLTAQGWTFLIALGLTAVIIATTASVYRLGLGALGASWGEWARGFTSSAGGRAPQTLLVFLLAYEPLLVVFAIVGAVRAFRQGHRAAQWLVWLCLITLAVIMLRNGRTLFDLIWLGVPLAALAGWALAGVSESAWAREELPLVAAQVGIIVTLLIFAGLNLSALAEQLRVNPDIAEGSLNISGLAIPVSRITYLYLSVVALGLVLVVSYLFAMGWSPRAARLGLILGGCVALLGMNLSAGWGLTQLRVADPVELWWPQPTADDVQQLLQVLESTSNYAVGNEHDIQVTVQASPEGALAWALRDFPHAEFVAALGATVDSPLVISPRDDTKTTAEQAPQLGSTYVGQAFTLHYSLASVPTTWPDQLGWYLFRRAATQPERIILWVRQDIQQLKTANGR